MAEFNDTQISPEMKPQSKLIQALQIVFGRSPRQLDIVKGKDQPQEKYGSFDSIENRLSKIFTGYTDIQYDRMTKYRDYDRMDTSSTECQTGLDIYAEEASQKDDKSGLRVWIESDDDTLAEELNGMLQRTRTEFKAYGLYRNLAKYGDCFIYVMPGGYGVHDYQFVHPCRVERMQQDGLLGFKSAELASHLPVDNKLGIFKPWDFVHLRITAYDQESVYGRSFLEPIRKVYKQLSMLECYDDKTEVLTYEGWKLFKDVKMNDKIATRNPDTKEFEWQLPTEIVNREHDGEMIELKSRSMDLLVTPDHRILLSGGTPKNLEGPIEKQAENEIVIRAQEMVGRTNKSIGTPVTSKWSTGVEIKEKIFSNVSNQVTSIRDGKEMSFTTVGSKERVINGDDFCALMGMYLAEGCLLRKENIPGKAGGLSIAQQKNSKGYSAYKEVLNRINGGTDVPYDGYAFSLNWKALIEYFEQFGLAADKFIPEEIMNTSQRQLKIFFDYFVLGDGSFRKYRNAGKRSGQTPVLLSTISKKLADQFMEVAQKLGFAASITTRPAHKQVNKRTGKEMDCKESYTINIKYSKINSFEAKKVQYKGNVYCVKVPNTIVYVRRNGKAAWSGNTMLVLYRIAKAVQRNIFYVDVGQASVAETTSLVKDYERFLKNKQQFIDPKTNEFKLEFNPSTILQDIVWPVRPSSLSKVEQLQNTSSIGPLEDVEHFRNKIRLGLNIPKEYFDGETASGMWNSREALMLQDARFGRKITKLQDGLREGIIKLCQIHWAIAKGQYLPPDSFIVQLGTISSVADRQREDILLRKAQILEILANISVVMGWNRWVWGDYLLDEIFPLPAQLRAKLQTPDPVMQQEFDKQKDLASMGGGKSGAGAMKAVKPNKPPKKTTADNVKKGLRSFGYGEDILSKVPELLEEFQEIEEKIRKPYYITEASMLGFSKDELTPLIDTRQEVAQTLQGKQIDFDSLYEMNKPPEQTLNKKKDPLNLVEDLEKEFLDA